jgi:hypothetical protein
MAGPPKVLKIAVTADGRLTADGRAVTIEELTPILPDLAKSNGKVWHYREAAQAEPHPNALRVVSSPRSPTIPTLWTTKADQFHADEHATVDDLTIRMQRTGKHYAQSRHR